jgi:bilirubin oxidase
MDGGPHQSIEHGKTWNAQIQIRQPASTFWYHSHTHHKTGEQVYKGMAGLFYIDDDESMQLDIPSEYGVDDLPVVLQDRSFHSNGEFRYASMMPEKMHGMHGDTLLVNGVVSPTLQAQKTLIRLRLLNGSNARIYKLAFHDNRAFHMIAGDASFLASPVKMNRLLLAPGERAEILVDVSDRKQVILKSLKGAVQTSGMMGMMMGRMGFDREFDVMKIDARQAETSSHQLPRSLIKPIRLNPADAVRTRPMKMSMNMMGGMGGMMSGMTGGQKGGNSGGFTINGESMDINHINFSVKRNTSEIWEVSNTSPLPHPFHVHNTQFQILSRNSRQPYAHERGLKDTVVVNSDEVVRILVPFRYYSDSKIPYMYHCHNLEHEDQGMMGQFRVG